jgi:uncharacterized Ntn-hydrolase superfamily protein
MLGGVIATSSPAVGSRCLFAQAGVGVVLTQHLTDPRLGPEGLALLSRGLPAELALAALVEGATAPAIRQIAVLSQDGRSAQFSGAAVQPALGAAQGVDCVAIGNILRHDGVPAAMVAAFEAEPDAPLPQRLLSALEAGEAAGGEPKPLVSAALLVVRHDPFPYADLRVDSDRHPICALRRLWEEYEPVAETYVARAYGGVG